MSGWSNNPGFKLLSLYVLTYLLLIASAQLALYELDINQNAGKGIFVTYHQDSGYAHTTSWIEYNGTIDKEKWPQGLISFTFCQRPRMYLFTYAYDDDDTNELYSEYHLGRQAFRICKKGTKYCAWHREMPDFKQWRSSCVTYDHFRDSYKLYIDGVQVESGTWAGDNAPEPIRPGGVFVAGQDQDKLRGEYNPRQSWSGSLTQMNLWDFSIEKWDIENIAECRSDVFGNVVKWEESMWIFGNVSKKLMPAFSLCDADEEGSSFYLFPDPFGFHFYNAFCDNLGGFMPIPVSEENNHELMDVIESLVKPDIHEKCMHASGNIIVWLGITDEKEEDVWADADEPYLPLPFPGFWEDDEPNGGELQNCVRTYLDRRWQDQSCDSVFCAVCEFPERMNLTMRDVKLMEGFFDTEYFIEGYVSMKPHWRGLGKSHIYFLPKRKVWRLESFYATEKYADLTADDTDPFAYYPLGRLNWKIYDGICQMSNGATRSLTLTTCFPNKFTCDDGSCVRINQRCNLVVDCPDKSDEKDCEILRLDDNYRGELFPRELDNSALTVFMNVSILAFPKIDTLELYYTADFVLTMRWRDPRLEWYDLRGATDLNTLNREDQSRIWSPTLSFTNAKIIGGSKVDSITSTVVQRIGQPLPDDIARALEANVYNGVDGYIIMSREYFIDWTCDYELVFYPFDTQVCKMMFDMTGATREYVDMDIDFEGVEYTGPTTLLEYVVGEMMLKNMGNATDSTYAGPFNSFRFLQSVLLLVVAYTTFYYRVDNFQDRMMVTITCILNIIIIIMVYHTYMTAHIGEAFAPNEDDMEINRIKNIAQERLSGNANDKNNLWNQFLTGGGDPVDTIEDATRINKQGQIIFVVGFFLFQIIFWGVAMAEFIPEKKIEPLTKVAENIEVFNKQRTV